MKKITRMIVLAVSVVTGIYLTFYLEKSAQYSEYIISNEQYKDITAKRSEESGILDALVFDEETLFFDEADKTFYYSLIEGNSGAYNPNVKGKGNSKDLEIAFLSDEITEEVVRNNQTITVLAYTSDTYCEYYLKCTTLPLMNIDCPEEPSDDLQPMNITVFDNQQGAASRITCSEGTIRIRGLSTRDYPKKGYRLYLTRQSLGDHERSNDVSLLGMRQDDDWLLYAAYNDQEKIRNVFSANLWEYTCAADNAQGSNTGMEYKYLELFLNGKYWGLYALGYPIDKKQLQLNAQSDDEALYKFISWVNERDIRFTDDGGVDGCEMKGISGQREDWSLFLDYYNQLFLSADDNEALYGAIDIDNAIDIYLFMNLIQGLDNVTDTSVKNLYLSIRNNHKGMSALYAPWDMDVTWGNEWTGNLSVNNTLPYQKKAAFNRVMESGYLNQLIVNNDALIWNKIFEKYRHLRAAGWSEETLDAMLNQYEADIYGSGAYLRDMGRWPEGTYADAADGLKNFRAYVMERLKEADLYYERLETLCNESIFIRRSAQYKDFHEYHFMIEINNKNLLKDSDYIDLFEYIGVDLDMVTDDVHFIIANPSVGKFDYLPDLFGDGEVMETCAGQISYAAIREGVSVIYLDGTACYETSIFSKPEMRMVLIKDKDVETFHFERSYEPQPQINTMEDLSRYVDALSITGYHAIIEINNPQLWQNPVYRELFEKFDLSKEAVSENTDFIIWDGLQKEAFTLNGFHVSGSRSDTPIGILSLFENDKGEYGVYLNNDECFVSSAKKNEEAGIRIVLLDSDSYETVDCAVFLCDL